MTLAQHLNRLYRADVLSGGDYPTALAVFRAELAQFPALTTVARNELVRAQLVVSAKPNDWISNKIASFLQQALA